MKELTEPTIINKKVDKFLGGVNTPDNIASDMVDVIYKEIEDKVDKTWRFLNICCKTGVYLKQLYFRLLNNKNLIQEIPDYFERRAWILKEMLFGICPSDNAKAISSLYLYGFDLSEFEDNLKVVVFKERFSDFKETTEPQINCLVECRYDDYAKLCKNKLLMDEFVRLCKAYNINTELSYSDQVEELKRAFEKENFIREGKKMKFDIVIGNPPYNNDIYLEFVTLGHNLADKMSCWITPAKWQAKGGERNDKFRENIVPYMKEIVYYPDCSDVFDIAACEGISYYLIHKNSEFKIKHIINKASMNPNIKSEREREIGYSLFNIINDLYLKIKPSNYLKFKVSDSDKFKVITGKLISFGGDKKMGTLLFSRAGTLQALMPVKCIECTDEIQNGYASIFSSNSLAECESFASYIQTKFIRFLLTGRILGYSTMLSEETWKYIPDPGKFDHIFTDAELYAKYGLTDEEINIIESVIKERK